MMVKLTVVTLAGVLLAVSPSQASAANTPCSGRKGGVSHCQGRTFICNDGSVSASKRNCSADMGSVSSGAVGLLSDPGASEMAPTVGQVECSCRSGQFCVGPRGGHYCFTDSGRKSYLRK